MQIIGLRVDEKKDKKKPRRKFYEASDIIL